MGKTIKRVPGVLYHITNLNGISVKTEEEYTTLLEEGWSESPKDAIKAEKREIREARKVKQEMTRRSRPRKYAKKPEPELKKEDKVNVNGEDSNTAFTGSTPSSRDL